MGENISLLSNVNIKDFLNFFKLFLMAETLREKCPNTEIKPIVKSGDWNRF